MFKGLKTIYFVTDKPKEYVNQRIADLIGQTIGPIVSAENDTYYLNTVAYNDFSQEVSVGCTLYQSETNYSLVISYESKPTAALWVLAIIGFFCCSVIPGIILILLPLLRGQSDVEKKINIVSQQINVEFPTFRGYYGVSGYPPYAPQYPPYPPYPPQYPPSYQPPAGSGLSGQTPPTIDMTAQKDKAPVPPTAPADPDKSDDGGKVS